jgi:hypothetical protein
MDGGKLSIKIDHHVIRAQQANPTHLACDVAPLKDSGPRLYVLLHVS